MGTIAKVTAGGATHLIASTAYGTCPTAANTAAKVATIQDSQAFTLVKGETINIRFTYSNTAASPTLNVNSTGAKPIYLYGTSTSDRTAAGTTVSTSWNAGSIVALTYDTTINTSGCWIINDYRSWYAQSVGYTPEDTSWSVTDVASALDDLKENASSAAAPVYIDYEAEPAASLVEAALAEGKRVYCVYTYEVAEGITQTTYLPLNFIYREEDLLDYYYFQAVCVDPDHGYDYSSKNSLWTIILTDQDLWEELEIIPWGGTYTGVSPISVSGSTISHSDSGVSASTYTATYNDKTSAWYIPTITVNATGHITSASNYGASINLTEEESKFKTYGFTKTEVTPWYQLASTSTTSTIYVSSPVSSAFYVANVFAWDSDMTPVLIDWQASTSTGYWPAASTAQASITVTVSEAYGKIIYYSPVLVNTTTM